MCVLATPPSCRFYMGVCVLALFSPVAAALMMMLVDEVVGLGAVTVLGVLEQGKRACWEISEVMADCLVFTSILYKSIQI